MLKRVLAVLLISGVLQGQQLTFSNSNLPIAHADTIAAGLGVGFDERHNLLRRGYQEDIAVFLCSPPFPNGSCGFTDHRKLNGITPVSLMLDLPPEITASYRKGRKYLPISSGAPVHLSDKNDVLLLRMIAGSGTPLGVLSIRGILQYEIAEPGQAATTQAINTVFQATVVEHNTEVVEHLWPYGSHPGQHVKDVALVPIEIFQSLLLWIGCIFHSCDSGM
ncbi:MAG: hypothetical protein LAO76_18670 [Acidobacteriia bacterium]|nr:hypothetical protein [Terriglobia bacterium]